ncbi:MAG: hypothetical protein AB8E15_06265 [Bdellovibrionales bacterium]
MKNKKKNIKKKVNQDITNENYQTEVTFEGLHNKKPVTRRDFLATGLIPFAASIVTPSLLQVIGINNAHAQGASRCSAGGSASQMPGFINVNLGGGSGLSSHAIPLDKGGQMISSYSKIGLGTRAQLSNQTSIEFGNSVWYANSTFLEGLKETAGNAINNTSFVSVCVESRDDTAENKIDISGMVDKVRSGEMLPGIFGNRNRAAMVAPKAPVNINNVDDLERSILLTGDWQQQLGGKANQEKLIKLVSSMNDRQLRDIASMTYGSKLQNLVKCAGIKNSDLISRDELGTDPMIVGGDVTDYAGVWGVDADTGSNSRNYVFGSAAFNAIKGNAPLANLMMGGYDYHDNTRTNGDEKDRVAGQMVGRILASAAQMNKEVFCTVTTDGCVTSPDSEIPGEAVWTSDGGTRGMWYMFAFSPNGRPNLKDQSTVKGSQLGSFKEGQGVDESEVIGGIAEIAAAGVFLNYLGFAGQIEKFNEVVGRGIISESDYDKINKFGG